MKITNQLILPLVIVTLLFTSCSSDDDNSNSEVNTTFNFTGTIVDVLNEPIESSTVILGDVNEATDINGEFTINSAEILTEHAYIITKKEGYLNGMRTLNDLQEENTVRITLLKDQFTTLISAGIGDSFISIPTGFHIKTDGFIKREDGSLYTGFLYPVIHHITPSNPDIENIVPGNYQSDNDTYGFAYVKLELLNKEQLDIADGHIATLEFKIEDSLLADAPATVGLWNFNEETGLWVEYGEATQEVLTGFGTFYTANVSSFSSPWFKLKTL